MCVCVCGFCVDAQAFMGKEIRVIILVFSGAMHLIFQTGSLSNVELMVRLDWLVIDPRRSICLSFPGIIRIITLPGSFFFFLRYGFWDPNSGLMLEFQAFCPPSYLLPPQKIMNRNCEASTNG